MGKKSKHYFWHLIQQWGTSLNIFPMCPSTSPLKRSPGDIWIQFFHKLCWQHCSWIKLCSSEEKEEEGDKCSLWKYGIKIVVGENISYLKSWGHQWCYFRESCCNGLVLSTAVCWADAAGCNKNLDLDLVSTRRCCFHILFNTINSVFNISHYACTDASTELCDKFLHFLLTRLPLLEHTFHQLHTILPVLTLALLSLISLNLCLSPFWMKSLAAWNHQRTPW